MAVSMNFFALDSLSLSLVVFCCCTHCLRRPTFTFDKFCLRAVESLDLLSPDPREWPVLCSLVSLSLALTHV